MDVLSQQKSEVAGDIQETSREIFLRERSAWLDYIQDLYNEWKLEAANTNIKYFVCRISDFDIDMAIKLHEDQINVGVRKYKDSVGGIFAEECRKESLRRIEKELLGE